MKAIRSLTSTRSPMHRIFVTLAFAGVLIAGLLAMHTLSAGDTLIDSTPTSPATHSQYKVAQYKVAVDGAAVEAAHCTAECGSSAPLPDHSMLLMACALIVLAVVLVVFAPARLARLSASLSLKGIGRDAARVLVSARPPSLLVLSVCRT